MKIMDNCKRCGKYTKLDENGLCRKCRKELEEKAKEGEQEK